MRSAKATELLFRQSDHHVPEFPQVFEERAARSFELIRWDSIQLRRRQDILDPAATVDAFQDELLHGLASQDVIPAQVFAVACFHQPGRALWNEFRPGGLREVDFEPVTGA